MRAWIVGSGVVGVALFVVLHAALPAPDLVPQPTAPEATQAVAGASTFSQPRLPLEFEPNVGQAAPDVRYVGRGDGAILRFHADRVVMGAPGGAVELRFVGAGQYPELRASGPTGGRSNYFVGDDPEAWRTEVPRYSTLRYSGIYPGIDVVFRDNGESLEYDFVVGPGGDPGAIRVALKGADELELEPSGDLVATAGLHRIVQRAPVVFQQDVAGRVPVEGEWRLNDDGTLGFDVGTFDRGRPLVIDPVVEFSTYLGGSGGDQVRDLTVDEDGYIFLAGNTGSINFPVEDPFDGSLSGSADAFVAKLDPSGQRLVFSTYFGGSDGDVGSAIAIGRGRNVHLAGFTSSSDLPTLFAFQDTFGGGQDGFVAIFNPMGSFLVRSSFLGGAGSDSAADIAVDDSGNFYLSGLVQSSDFPVTAGVFQLAYGGNGDVYVTKVDSAGNLAYSSYLGGSSFETGGHIEVDPSGNLYVVGITESADFPIMNGLDDTFGGGDRDGFVAKVSPTGSALLWSTFIGGNGTDSVADVALDPSMDVHITGLTGSTDFPVDDDLDPTLGGSHDAFAMKIDPAGTSLLYSRYLGGSATDFGTRIAVDRLGQAHLVGETTSPDFPVAGAFQSTLAGLQDAMVVKLSLRGAIVWSTYLGGSDMESSTRLALDRDGVVHVGGLTLSSDFPVERALDSIMSGQTDGFVAKLFDPLEFFIGSVLGDRPAWSGAPALVESGAPAVVESGAPAVVESGAPAVGRTAGDVPRQLRSR